MIGALLARWLQPALYAALAVTLTLLALRTVQLHRERAEHATAMAKVNRAAAEAQEQARMRERAWLTAVEIERRKLDDERRTIAGLVAQVDALNAALEQARSDVSRLLGDRRVLREALARFAAGTADDTAAACRERAGTLADVLAEGAGLLDEGARLVAEAARLVAACGRDHDERAAEVRALLAAWPK